VNGSTAESGMTNSSSLRHN